MKRYGVIVFAMLVFVACSDEEPSQPTTDMGMIEEDVGETTEITVVSGARWVPDGTPTATSDGSIVMVEDSVLVAGTPGVADVTLDGSILRVTVEPRPWQNLQLSSNTLCIQRGATSEFDVGQDTYCTGDWGPEGYLSTPRLFTEPSGSPPFLRAMRASDSIVCGIDDGDARCRGNLQFDTRFLYGDQFSSEFQTYASEDQSEVIALDVHVVENGHACIVTENGDVQCWGSDYLTDPGSVVESPRSMGLSGQMKDVSLGTSQGCAFNDTEITCWGRNHAGELGVEEQGLLSEPVTRALDGTIVQVASGFKHVCALLQDGRLLCSGDASRWSADRTNHVDFVEVQLPERVLDVSASSPTTCVRTFSGRALCGGLAFIADPTGADEEGPRELREVPGFWIEMVSGLNSTCGMDYKGVVQCLGVDVEGHLGVGRRVSSAEPVRFEPDVGDITSVGLDSYGMCFAGGSGVECRGIPYRAPINPGVGSREGTAPFAVLPDSVDQIVTHLGVTSARTSDGLISWGSSFGGLGNGSRVALTPTPIVERSPIDDFDLGVLDGCYVSQGDVYCWGLSLVTYDFMEIETPERVEFSGDPSFDFASVALSGISNKAAAIDTTGRLAAFGGSFSGELPRLDIFEADSGVYVDVTGLGNGLCAWTDEGDLVCRGALSENIEWGFEWTAQESPTVTAAAFGNEFGCIIDDAGAIHCIGDGSHGQLGPDHESSTEFVATGFEGTFTEIWAGADKACALNDAGELWCWGGIDRAGEASATNAVQAEFEPVQLR